MSVATTAQPQFLKIAEAAAELRISTKTLYGLVQDGTVRSVRIGRSIRIAAAELQRLAAAPLAANS